jgi:signal transduction histidine kinase
VASFGRVDAHEIVYADGGEAKRTALLWLREVSINLVPHVLLFLLDITDRKRMEEDLRRARSAAEAAARAKSAFLANMSHEIRTPLNGVLGLSSLLAGQDLNGDDRALLKLIRASGETLAKILDDVLDYSKIECGKLELEEAPFSLRESLDWSAALFRAQAEEKHLNLSVQVSPEVPELIAGDATRSSSPRRARFG